MQKLPPPEKIIEAYSAIADNRILMEQSQARVASSNRAKEYIVTWQENTYTSNDSATYWQGYAGYPIIAVLMMQGKLALDHGIAHLFADINWTALNQQYKRNYTKAVQAVIQECGYDPAPIEKAVHLVAAQLKELELTIKRGSLKPPK